MEWICPVAGVLGCEGFRAGSDAPGVPGREEGFRAVAGVLGWDGFRPAGGGEDSSAPAIVRDISGFGDATSSWVWGDARGTANGFGES